ncbi:hypothetical protein M8J77_023149 [Diaphorina citri]|nr:hypothetical protein M8J77_023149 [Diaphorina citri]
MESENILKKFGNSLFCMTVARTGIGQVCSPTTVTDSHPCAVSRTLLGEDAVPSSNRSSCVLTFSRLHNGKPTIDPSLAVVDRLL